MLLKRITQYIKKQNWLAVALEFFIVVLGIFVGLQVDNWNEERKTRSEEYEYLIRLSQDAAGSLSQGQFMRDFMVRSAEREGIVLRALEECFVDSDVSVDFANGLYHLGKLFPPYMVTGTIEELRSTGKLGILRSTELRKQLDATIREYERFSLIYTSVDARILPHVVYVDSTVAFKIDAPQTGDSDIAWEDIDLDLDTLCEDRRFYTAIASVRNYSYDVVAWHDRTMAAIERFKSTVDMELNRFD